MAWAVFWDLPSSSPGSLSLSLSSGALWWWERERDKDESRPRFMRRLTPGRFFVFFLLSALSVFITINREPRGRKRPGFNLQHLSTAIFFHNLWLSLGFFCQRLWKKIAVDNKEEVKTKKEVRLRAPTAGYLSMSHQNHNTPKRTRSKYRLVFILLTLSFYLWFNRMKTSPHR